MLFYNQQFSILPHVHALYLSQYMLEYTYIPLCPYIVCMIVDDSGELLSSRSCDPLHSEPRHVVEEASHQPSSNSRLAYSQSMKGTVGITALSYTLSYITQCS